MQAPYDDDGIHAVFAGIYVDVRWHKTQLSDLARGLLPRSRHITRRCHLEKLYDPVYRRPPLLYADMRRHVFILMRVTSLRAPLRNTHAFARGEKSDVIRKVPLAALPFRDGYYSAYFESRLRMYRRRNMGYPTVELSKLPWYYIGVII